MRLNAPARSTLTWSLRHAVVLAAGNYLSHSPTGSPSTRARISVGGIRLGTMAAWLLYEIKAREGTLL